MAILKCKMCGSDIRAKAGRSYGTCDTCGGTMTLPRASEPWTNFFNPNLSDLSDLYNRANHFRRQNEFDKALAVYESILNENGSDAEAHWGVVLCHYGVEYVKDGEGSTHTMKPTCHRAQFEPIFSNSHTLAALEYAPDEYCHSLYEKEAAAIDEIQKGILAIAQNEEPYDIFICCDSEDPDESALELAQDIFTYFTHGFQLTNAEKIEGEGEGEKVDKVDTVDKKVFFPRFAKNTKNKQEYEPYIFAALHSAKVMLVVGTKPEHFNSVWVKNQWSRFLALMKKADNADKADTADKNSGKLLIPCYRDMEPYDLPEALSMQSQDMSKSDAMEALLSRVEKVGKNLAVVPGLEPKILLYGQGTLLLKDEEWEQADECFDKVLDIDPEYVPAYVGKLCAELKIETEQALVNCHKPISESLNYRKALRLADTAYGARLEEYRRAVERNIEADQERLKARREAEQKQKLFLSRSSAITAGIAHTLGLKTDGTVLISGGEHYGQLDVSSWQNIVAISAKGWHTVGLKSDGTVVAVGHNKDGQCDVSGWRDIIAISAGHKYTVGLKWDGTVIAVGHNEYGRCNVSGWSDIVAISAGFFHTVGLKSNGTVVAIGINMHNQCNVSNWSNIIAVSAGDYHTVGLKSNGRVVAIGDNKDGQCNVSEWNNMGPADPEKIRERERREQEFLNQKQRKWEQREQQQRESRERERQRAEWFKQGRCLHCGGEFGGIFIKKCKSCGKPR